jgi:molybdate transport system substrate-binding protein
MNRILCRLLLACLALPPAAAGEAAGGRFTVAAAADLRYALDEIAEVYRMRFPQDRFEVVYGSSGKMTTQIMHGAPYDIFFSADIAFPERLQAAGYTASEPAVYAIGRIVLWSNSLDASALTLADLARDPRIRRVAIAQPAHAPYGQRAQEALEASGAWEAVRPRLVFGENIAHAAQMVESGAADVGIIALSLARFPALAEHPHHLIDEDLHQPLTQGFVITRRAAGNEAAWRFAAFMASPEAHAIMQRYGFMLPATADEP